MFKSCPVGLKDTVYLRRSTLFPGQGKLLRASESCADEFSPVPDALAVPVGAVRLIARGTLKDLPHDSQFTRSNKLSLTFLRIICNENMIYRPELCEESSTSTHSAAGQKKELPLIFLVC